MKKIYPLFLIFILIIPFSLADITITTEQQTYNLGNKIKASASVLQSDNFEGLFKLKLSCENYELEYFLTPVSLESNFRTAVSVPEVAATQAMLGICSIMGDLITNDNLVIEEEESNSFNVTNQLTILPVNNKITSLPHETITATGVVNEAFGNNILKASAKISLDNNSYDAEVFDGKFNLSLELSKNIKSGKHTIEITASDSKNNIGSSSIELEITAVPSYIKIELSGDKFEPGLKVEIASSLYDQADDLINFSLDLELTSPSGNKVFRKVVQSNEKISYEFSQYAEPGIYTLVSTYNNLFTQNSINISTIREVKVKYENETVFVENIGNVVFEDELTFLLESDSKKYPITKKVKIEPSKTISIELSKEVPLGTYDVFAPIKKGIEPIAGKVTEKIEDIVEEISESVQGNIETAVEKDKLIADDVTIHDNRPAYKKIATSFASISSDLVGADGMLTKNPLIAPITLIVVIALIVFRYGRKPIMRMIKGKKDDEGNQN